LALTLYTMASLYVLVLMRRLFNLRFWASAVAAAAADTARIRAAIDLLTSLGAGGEAPNCFTTHESAAVLPLPKRKPIVLPVPVEA
jgi:hypothetical protein